MATTKRLLGIGNPLLDISVNVDPSYLLKYNKKVGDASLATESDLAIYKEIMGLPDVVYIAGGATQNSIRGAQWMLSLEPGLTHYVGSVGDDENGKKLKAAAERDGVQTHYYISKTHRTGCCAVLVVNHERSLVADLAAANDYQHSHFETPAIQELVSSVEVFYSAGFFLTVSPQTVVALGQHCMQHNKVLVWGVAAPFVVQFYWDRVQQVLPYVDYLVANETEAEALLKKLDINDTDMEVAMKKVSELPKVNKNRERVVIFTHGPKPVMMRAHGKHYVFPVPPVPEDKIVDTNGAGDAFLGGFLSGLMQDKPLEECMRAALFAARYILQVSGTQYTTKCDFEWK